jgi:signal transduction histidine kinase
MSVNPPPATQQWLDVRRLFTRFILLVVVPTVGLVAFGVLAITNERAAVEQRFADQYRERLHTLAEHLASTLEATASRLTRSDPLSPSSLVRFDFVLNDGHVLTTPPSGADVENALAVGLNAFPVAANGAVSLLSLQAGPARGLYAVRRETNGTLRGIAFSEQGLAQSVAREGAARFTGERARFSVEGPREPAGTAPTPFRAMLEAMTERSEQGIVSFPLSAPLADWRIVATLPGDDPIRSALVRNRTIYIVTLALFYLIITIGVVVTLRGILREVRLSRLKTDFVSNISHELRTPLTSIRMFAETLRAGRTTSPEEQALCIDFIAKESERLSLIAERTLDWARLEAGRRPFERQHMDPASLVRGVVETFLSHGTIDHEAIELDLPSDLPEVDVDSAAIGQVILNLLENSVKYSGANKHIIVRARRHRSNVLIEVEDNGIGIARKDQRRVFERFYRADDLLARRTEGSGLGLSIARRIVVAHTGRLTVRSRLGVGSTFTIQLPAAPPARTAPAPSEIHA